MGVAFRGADLLHAIGAGRGAQADEHVHAWAYERSFDGFDDEQPWCEEPDVDARDPDDGMDEWEGWQRQRLAERAEW